MTWETVIGLEIHVQLATKSKIFSPAAAGYCEEPNRQVREVDGGMPGALPVLNREAVEFALRLGLALESEICSRSEFARKNYFYPDLPKGYQISQYEYPLLRGGRLRIDVGGGEKEVGITRAHLEEDAGKLLHSGGGSAVDLNRAGAPLLEVVSEPEIFSAEEASAYGKAMHQLVRWLEICDGNMQEGSFRMDANISLRRPGEPLGTRCEIKNLNSFRFLEQALRHEAVRQRDVLESGGEIIQQTRLFDSASGETRAMRGKEDASDYRYFPDPDLPPLSVGEEWIAKTRAAMPELPRARRARFAEELQLPPADAASLTAGKELADYFESTLAAMIKESPKAKKTGGGEVVRQLDKRRIVGAVKQTQANGGGGRSEAGAAGRTFDDSYRGRGVGGERQSCIGNNVGQGRRGGGSDSPRRVGANQRLRRLGNNCRRDCRRPSGGGRAIRGGQGKVARLFCRAGNESHPRPRRPGANQPNPAQASPRANDKIKCRLRGGNVFSLRIFAHE